MYFNGYAQKPKVWMISDGSDKNIQGSNHWETISDPDDIPAIAGYLLMSNEFDTRGIVVDSHHGLAGKNIPDQKKWADDYFGKAHAKDLPALNKNIEGHKNHINFIESCIKSTGEKYNPAKNINR